MHARWTTILLWAAAAAIQVVPVHAGQPTAASDSEIVQLLDRTEVQVADGHVWAPAGDNALETVRLILQLLPEATPEAVAEVSAMPKRLRERAAIEDAAGRAVEAHRFILFAEALAPGRGGQVIAAPAVTRTGAEAVTAAAPPDPPATAPPAPPEPPAQPLPDAADAPPAPPPAPATPQGEAKAVATGAPAPTAAAAPAAPPPAPTMARASAAPDSEALPPGQVAILIRRGDAMLAVGDISAARLLYGRAAEAGSAEAALKMGDTNDPEMLAHLKARGIRPDPEMAATWYRRAAALGEATAADHLHRLEVSGAR